MGHERIGFLPKTTSWKKIVKNLEIAASGTDADFSSLASNTLELVRKRFLDLHKDAGVQAAFGFLVALSRSEEATTKSRAAPNIQLPSALSPLRLSAALNDWVDSHAQSQEYAEIAKRSAAEALTSWHIEQTSQPGLFHDGPEHVSANAWAKASSGAGFSDVSRVFLARFTERYLRYFLEREASASIKSISARDTFSHRLHDSLDLVSRHAFETSKIAQSFAAGWFNKHAREQTPTNANLSRFLRVAFSKMREELRREASR